MILDQGHRRWLAVTVVLLAASSAAYWWYVRSSPDGPAGGSPPGMAFGIAGTALMLFAGLLSLRKKVPGWPIGTARFWLKGHIWLGLLSVPLILFHAGFRWGGLLEQVLLLVFAAIIISGIFGLALQQYLPRLMRTELPSETMYNQADEVCRRLRLTADDAVAKVCGVFVGVGAAGEDGGGGEEPAVALGRFYRETVRPFLEPAGELRSALSSEVRAASVFAQVRNYLPGDLAATVVQLEQICAERRQLATQTQLRGWLHGWLFVHIPLSISLLVLTVIHIVMSLYY